MIGWTNGFSLDDDINIYSNLTRESRQKKSKKNNHENDMIGSNERVKRYTCKQIYQIFYNICWTLIYRYLSFSLMYELVCDSIHSDGAQVLHTYIKWTTIYWERNRKAYKCTSVQKK